MTRGRQRSAGAVLTLSLAVAGAVGLVVRGAAAPSASVKAPARASAKPAAVAGTPRELARRLEQVSRRRIGTHYELDPLGEGPAGRVDRDPIQTWKDVDCVTFVEQCLAEALVLPGGDAVAFLQRIRYRGGQIGFETRNHYTLADWVPNNRWFVRDVTAAVGGSACATTTKTIDRAALLRQRGGDASAGGAPQRLSIRYLPRAAFPKLAGRIPDASLIVLVSGKPDLDATHVGFVFVRDGERRMRHASQRRGEVIDEPLLSAVQRWSRGVIGAAVFSLTPPQG